ncbi:MAG: putative Ig domain-containing protein [Prosthecobacter sp.]
MGTDSASFTTQTLMGTTNYWVKVTNAANPAGALSNTAIVTVLQPAAITSHPASTTINSGQSTTLSVIATGEAPLTYQWYEGDSGVTTKALGTNSASFTTPTLMGTTNYWVKVTNAANPAGAISNTAVVTVLQPAAISTHPASTTINSGQSTTLSVVASGDAPFTYQWYQGDSGVTTTAVGTNSASFTTPTLIGTTNFWVKVTNAANLTGANSNTAIVTVQSPAAITTHPASTIVNSGQSTTLSVVASGDGPLTYQWYQGDSGVITTPVGTNSASFTTPALTLTTSYWVKITNAANPGGALSTAATVTVLPVSPPSAYVMSQNAGLVAPSSRGLVGTTWFGWEAFNEPAARAQPIDDSTPDIGTTMVEANFQTTNSQDHVLDNGNLSFTSGTLAEQITVPTNGTIGSSGFTTLVLQIAAVSGSGAFAAPITLSSINGLAPTVVQGLNSGGDGQLWAKWDLPGNQASYLISISGAPGQANFSFDRVMVDSLYSMDGYLADSMAALPPSITTASPLPVSVIDVPLSQQLAGAGGTAPYLFTVNAGTLPAGLTLSTSGLLSGTPTATTASSFTVLITDANGLTAAKAFELTITTAPSITTASPLPVSVVDLAFSQQLAGAGGTAPYQFTVNAGTLPAGLTLSTGGLLSGTPTATTASSFTVLITDANGLTATKPFDLTITTAPSITTVSPLPVSVVDVVFSQQLAGTGGTAPYQFTVSEGTLPAGLTLSISGLLSGTPTATTTSSFTVLITDANSLTATKGFNLTITTAPSITTASPLPVSVVDLALSQQLAGTGGTAPYQFTVNAGSLPSGLTLSTVGLLSGTPTATGTSNFTVLITDANSLTATKAFNLSITTAPSITTASPLPVSVVDVVFSQQFAGTGGTAPYQYTVSTGTLPAGLTLSTSGLLSGTPTATGTSHFTLLITDANGLTATKDFDLSITTAPVISTPSLLATGLTNIVYSVNLAASGGTTPYTWSLSSGTLPAGLSLNSAGVLSGTPTAPGTSNFIVQVQDDNGFTDTETYSVTMSDLVIATTTLPTAVKAVAYNHSLIGTGTSTPFTWAVTAGTLPAGITLSSGGVFSGTPTTPSSSIITVRLTDSSGFSVSKAFTLTVSPTFLAPIVQPISFTPITIGTAFSYVVSAQNYPKTFAITGLPKGLKFVATTGVISGSSDVSGVFNVQVSATNTGGTSPTVTARLIVKALNKNLVGTFGGLVTRDPVNRGLGGTLTVTTTSLGSYTIKLITASGSGHAATLYSITTGRLAATAPQISVLIGGQTLALTFNTTTGQITGSHGSAPVNGIRSIWNAVANPAENLAGYYSMALNLRDAPDKASASIPHGSGYATFSVSLAGSLTAVGKTADGEGITSASFLGANGEFWAYAPLYKNAGSIQGPLYLSQDAAGLFAGNVVSGSMTWFKLATTGPTYPASFGPTNVTVEGGYLAPASTGSVVLGLPDAGSTQLSFAEGGLGASATNPNLSFTYTSDNKVLLPLPAANPGKVALTINANTGVVAGTFALAEATPPTRSKVAFQGQVVRMTDGSVKAVGYFMLPQILTGGLTATTLPSLSGGFSIQSSVLVPAIMPSSDGSGLIGTTGVGLSITTTTLPTAVKAVAFNHSLTGLGGSAPYTWTVSAGTLPAGITLSAAGVLSGTPTVAGSSTFTVNLADTGGDNVTHELTLTVSATYLTPILQPIHFPTLTIGTAFSQTVSAQNYPKTFAITGLPKGLKFVPATGVISGVPAVSGIYNVQVRATNPGGSSAVLTVPLVVKALDKNLVGTFGGLVTRDPVNRNLGGTLTVTTTSIGSYSIKLISASGVGTAATLYSASGFLLASAPQISVLIGGQTLALTFNSTTGQITGTHGSAPVSGIRSAWNALANPAERLAGYYSMALDLTLAQDKIDPLIPHGSGFATFSVSLAGSLTAVGKTADGEGITSASFLGANGEFWAYSPLYKNRGSIQGPLNLYEDAAGLFASNVVSGSVTWFKPATTGPTYPATFEADVTAEGGYLAPASTGSVALGLPDAGSVALSFTDGGLASSITDPDMSFTYTSDNKVLLPLPAANPGKVTLAINGINANTGAVAGTFALAETTPPTRAKVAFQGQVVRMTDGSVKAVGYFMLPQILTGGLTTATLPSLSGGFSLMQPVR